MMGIRLVTEPNTNRTFKFGSQNTKSIETTNFMIPYAEDKYIEFHLEFIEVNIPFLYGLDKLDEYKT